MARDARVLRRVLLVALAASACFLALAGAAYAAPGDTVGEAVSLNPYLGSSLTTDFISGTIAPTGHFFLRVQLTAGDTLRSDVSPGPSVVNLEALALPISDAYHETTSVALPSGAARLTFTAPITGMYTVSVTASSLGTFTVKPAIIRTSTRIFGAPPYSDRIATAIAVSQHAFPGHAPAAVIAYGFNFPDALAAGPLAKAYGGPVLLTSTDSLRGDVIAELKRLAPATVFIVGAESVVGPNVKTQLSQLPTHPTVTRLGGQDRYDTAGRIADALRAKAGKPSRVVVVNGDGYADALSAAPLASAKGWPILLTRPASLPTFTRDAISRSGATASLLVGSANVVSDAVKNALPSPVRKGGKDRYETCGLVVDFAVTQGCSFAHVALATGTNFPDALSAGPFLAPDRGLLVLTSTDLADTLAHRLTANKAQVTKLDVIGSTSVVSDQVLAQAQAALR